MTQRDLLSRCLFCGYSLEGLPIEHKCPECGEAFDRRWRVFGGKAVWHKSTWGSKLSIVIGLTVWLGFIIFAVAKDVATSATVWKIAFNNGGAIVMLPMFVWLLFFRGGSQRVLVGPRGVSMVDLRKRDRKHYDWPRIRDAKVYGVPILRLNDRVMPVSLAEYTGLDTKALVACINAYPRLNDEAAQES